MPENSVRKFKNVMVRLGEDYVDDLDVLTEVNKRSRREIFEILIEEAMEELESNPDARLNYAR